MKFLLTVPKPDWANLVEEEFDLSVDGIKALLHADRTTIKNIPKKYTLGTEVKEYDEKTNQTYQFTFTQTWLTAFKTMDDYPDNFAKLQNQLMNILSIQTLCDESFALYQSWYFSGGKDRIDAMDRIKKFFEELNEKEVINFKKVIILILGCLIAERDIAKEQHMSQYTHFLFAPIFGEKPKFSQAIEPVINLYKVLLSIQDEKKLSTLFTDYSAAKEQKTDAADSEKKYEEIITFGRV